MTECEKLLAYVSSLSDRYIGEGHDRKTLMQLLQDRCGKK